MPGATCPRCKGSGRSGMFNCPQCRGKSTVQKCPRCGGKGTVGGIFPKTCDRCGGKGA